MAIFVLALSRLVPVIFLISLTLIGSRYIHDLVLPEHPRLARTSFIAIALLGTIATVPYAIRGGLIVGGTRCCRYGRLTRGERQDSGVVASRQCHAHRRALLLRLNDLFRLLPAKHGPKLISAERQLHEAARPR